MKRKILTLLLCVSMTATVLAGCATKDVDATDDKVTSSSSSKKDDDTVNVTKKLEKQYIECIEAYQEYYEKECDDYEYDLSARITINKDGLPLLWLSYFLDEDPDSAKVTQLLSYEDKEVKVLAELRNTCVCPLVSDEAVAALEWGEENIYIYDADNALFRKVEVPEDEWKEYINETLEEFSYYEYCICVNEEEQEISYIGKTNGRTNNYGASSDSSETTCAAATSEEGVEVTQPPIPYVDRKIVEIKENDEKFFYADGSVDSWEQAKEELNILEDYESSMLRIAEGGVEWLTEFEVDTMFRVLKTQPAYSSEQLVMTLVANSLYFEHSDGTVYSIGEPINLKEYNFAKASDGRKLELVSDYVYKGEYDARYMEETLYEQLDSEPYVTFRGRCYVSGWDWSWDIEEEEYADNVATFTMDDGTVCQFQIEFTEAGDKISKITYIDPMASMSDEEKQAYKVKTEVLPAYEKYVSDADRYSLVYIDDDEIPELITSTASWYNIYTYNGDVVDSGLAPNVLEFIEKANSIHITEGHGVFYDTIISIKNGMFESYAYGRHGDVYDDEGNYVPDAYEYYWDGRQVSESEYNDLLRSKFDYEKSKSIQNIEFYSTIQEAYDNIGNSHAVEVPEQEAVTETYHDMMYSCSEFELNNQRLLIDADSFNIDLEISDDCVWQTRYSDGSVYDSSYEDLHRIWENVLDSKQKLDEMGREYESPEGLGVEVKDGKVVAVYMTAS